MSDIENSSIENSDISLSSKFEQTNFDIARGKFNQLINQLDEEKREEIKPEFKEIAKRFQSFLKFVEFSKFVVNSLNGDINNLNHLHQRQGKSTILESLYSEYISHQLRKGNHTIKDESIIAKLIDDAVYIGKGIGAPRELENDMISANMIVESTVQVTDEWGKKNIEEENLSSLFMPEIQTETGVVDNAGINSGNNELGLQTEQSSRTEGKGIEEGKRYISGLEKKVNNRFKNLNIPEDEKRELRENLKIFANEVEEKYGLSSTGGNLLLRFLISNVENIETVINNGGREDVIKNLFFQWNEKKYDNIGETFFDARNLTVFATSQQILRLRGGERSDEDLKALLTEQLKGMGYDKENLKAAYQTYQNFTLEEVVGELILNSDLNDPEQLKKVQIIAGCFSNLDNILNIKSDGIWGPQTYAFFKMLQDNPGNLVNAPRYELYRKKIDEILKAKPKIEGSTAIYDSLDNVKNNLKDYWKYPRFRRPYGNGRMRGYRGDREIGNEYKDEGELNVSESEFIKMNQNVKLNQSIKDIFAFNKEFSRKERFGAQQRVLSILPKDKLKEIFGNEKTKKIFEIIPKILKRARGIPEEKTFSILLSIANGEKRDQESVDDDVITIYSSVWRACGRYIGKEFFGIIGYFRNQACINAIQVRDQLLEGALNFEITQLGEDIKRDDPEKGIFHFRDKNHMETSYIYNAKTGEIYTEEKVIRDDGVIAFNGSKKGRLVHVIPTYDESVSNIDVTEAIGLGEARAATTEELKKNISEKIKARMQYSVGSEELGKIFETNEVIQEKNSIISNLGKILNIDELIKDGELRKSDRGPYYEVFDAMINSLELCSHDDLKEVNGLLIKIVELKEKIDSGVALDESSLGNPILGFIIKNTKNIESLKGQRVKDNKLGGERRGEDIVYGSIFGKLLVKDSSGKNVIDIETCGLLNNLADGTGLGDEYIGGFEGYLSELEQYNIKNREDKEKQKDEKSAESLLKEIGEEE